MTKELHAAADGVLLGRVIQDVGGRLAFIYESSWTSRPSAFPLSLSMPMTQERHTHQHVWAFLWGLLPDNDATIARWAQRFQVSPRNPFALLLHVGEDCAGAVSFQTDPAAIGARRGGLEPLSETEIEERLRLLRTEADVGRRPSDIGRFSLAGAQPKTALSFVDGAWGVPWGAEPTTHILKPPTGEHAGFAENELFCLMLARACGMLAARAEVMRFGAEIAIVVERYDRRRTKTGVRRVHQEDLCQATSTHPASKYQSDGGPGVARVADLLLRASSRPAEDLARFFDALVFNWILAATDAHAKNYSLLLGGDGQVRLAPLYDIASILPYEHDARAIRSAMRIGGQYAFWRIGRAELARAARECRIATSEAEDRIVALIDRVRRLAPEVRDRMAVDGVAHDVVNRLTAALVERAASLR